MLEGENKNMGFDGKLEKDTDKRRARTFKNDNYLNHEMWRVEQGHCAAASQFRTSGWKQFFIVSL